MNNIREKAMYFFEESIRLKRLYNIREELYKKIVINLNPEDVKKSYNTDETQLYIFVQTDSGIINITLDLMESL